MGSCGRRRWPASPAPGLPVLGLGLCLDYKLLSKERNSSLNGLGGETSCCHRHDFMRIAPCTRKKMATVVRVKRRRDEDPLDVLFLSHKKAKRENERTGEGASKSSEGVLKFAGRVTSKVESSDTRVISFRAVKSNAISLSFSFCRYILTSEEDIRWDSGILNKCWRG